MKFLIVHNRYSRRGGEESVVGMQTKLLEDHGHEVVTYFRDHGDVGRVASFFTAMKNPNAVLELEDLVVAEKPDVAIVHNLFPVISAAVLPVLKRHGVKVLMTLHNYRLACPNGLFYVDGRVCEQCGTSKLGFMNCALKRCEGTMLGSLAWAVRSAYAHQRGYFEYVDKFMALSNFQVDKIRRYTGIDSDRFSVTPNCIDIGSMPDSTVTKSDFIGFVGRLSEEKGVRLLFETARLMPDVEFRVAGEKAGNISNNLPIPTNVELVGYLTKEQLADFYTSARNIVLTSSCYEGFPLTVIEAMYYRSTVIVPNWAALPEIVQGGECGELYEQNNAHSLVEAIKHSRASKGEEARARVIAKYNSEQYYHNILRCL